MTSMMATGSVNARTVRLSAPIAQLQPVRYLGSVQPLQRHQSTAMLAKRRAGLVIAKAATEEKPDVAQFADSIGLPTDEGIFGFKPFPELWVGRLAMAGFLSSVVGEFLTGRGTLQQIGLLTPNPALFYTMLAGFGGLISYNAARTIYRAQNKKMTAADLYRYRNFLGIQREQANIKEEQDKLKAGFRAGTDVASPDNYKTIEEAKQAGTPADSVLGTGQAVAGAVSQAAEKISEGGIFGMEPEAEAAKAAAEMKRREQEGVAPSMSLAAKDDVLEQSSMAGDADWAYAKNVEITNGRWAMIGFLTAIMIEAATGRGILLQLVGYAKALNLLGPASGV